jgi:replicative DNA helicase Mcm
MKYRYIPDKSGGGRDHYEPWFDCYGVRKVGDTSTSFEDASNSPEDIQYIQREMDQPGFYQKMVASFAPHIYGMNVFKEACLLAIASIGLDRSAKMLFTTDPGMGKSDLLKYSCTIAPNAHAVQMGRATKTGLTVSSEIDKETGRRHFVRGVFVAADQGLLTMDEMQMSTDQELMHLNDVIESGEVKYALPGGNFGVLNAKCAILMASNAHSGRIGDEKSIAEILRYMGRDLPQFLSRITLVLIMRDNFTSQEHGKIAEYIGDHDTNVPEIRQKYHENWTDQDSGQERFGKKWLRKIMHYVIYNVNSEQMSKEYQRDLIDNYVKNQTDVVSSVNKIAITTRFMRHGLDLARYIARLKGKNKAEKQDVDHAMELLQKSLEVAAFDPQTQTIDMNPFEGNKSKQEIRKLDDQSEVRDAIDKYMAEKDPDGIRIHKFFTVEGISEKLWYIDPIKWSDAEPKVRKIINSFLKQRLVYEKGAEGSGQYDKSW